MRAQPPSLLQWRLDCELNGHTVEETIRYWSDCEDWRERHGVQRGVPANVILTAEPPWWRRWLGR
jgi:hypothetical protein